MSEGDCWGVNVIIVMMGVCGRNGGRVDGAQKKVSEGHGNLTGRFVTGVLIR